jgi:hypothetical protein
MEWGMNVKALNLVVFATIVSVTLAFGKSPEPRLFVVIVDTSLTMKDFEPSQTAYKQIVDSLKPGDAAVVLLAEGRVIARPQRNGERRKPLEVVSNTKLREIEKQSVEQCTLNRAQFDCEDELGRARRALDDGFKKALLEPRSDKTELLFTVDEAAKYFAEAKGREPILIFLSDMLEDSTEANFELINPTPDFAEHYIAKRGTAQLPRLNNVRVYVAGASAADQQKFEAVKRFWIAYLSRAGAVINSNTYGNRLFGFNDYAP